VIAHKTTELMPA